MKIYSRFENDNTLFILNNNNGNYGVIIITILNQSPTILNFVPM